MPIVWVSEAAVLAIHDSQLAEHGGSTGVRDTGLLESALARPQNLAAYEAPDVAALAAAYAFGISRNHPFVDGNKRTAYVVAELFAVLNGFDVVASDADVVLHTEQLASGRVSEQEYAEWIRKNLEPLHE
jgi:death on curing protein